MIVRKLNECRDSDRLVSSETWDSTRMLLKDDSMGFSFHITRIFPNTETHIWYKNHLESVYCVSGRGEIETTLDGKVYQIEPGTLYVLDKNDEHYLRAFDQGLEVACVFNPPLTGQEVHDKEGVYPLLVEGGS